MLRFPIITALTIGLWLSHPASAMERYSIANISTQATGESATEARMTALESAEQQAFKQLMSDLLGDDVHPDHYPAPDATTISSMVSGYAVDDETVGRTSYKATLAVHFDPARVDRFLNRSASTMPTQAASPAYIQDYSKPATAKQRSASSKTLVVPLLRTGTGPMVWDDPNPWRNAWNAQPLQSYGIMLPLGDLDDMKSVPAERIANVDWDAVHALERRYPSSRIVIADAALVQSSTPGMLNLNVTMHDSSRAITPPPSFTVAASEVNDALFAQAMNKMLGMISGSHYAAGHQTEALRGSAPGNLSRDMRGSPALGSSELKILVPVTNIQQWINMRRKIQQLQSVQQLRVVAITPSQADVVLTHAGSTDSLQQALRSYGMQLTQQNNFWVLRETI